MAGDEQVATDTISPPRRDRPFERVGCALATAWIPILLLVSSDLTARILGVAVSGAVLIAAWRGLADWRRHPFTKVRDSWDKDQARLLREVRLERRDQLFALTPYQFEEAIAHLYAALGYDVHRTPSSRDGGWDVEIRGMGHGRKLIECKQYAIGRTVGRPILQKLHSAMVTERAEGAVCVTTGTFTTPATQFAVALGIELIDGQMLGAMMARAFGDEPTYKAWGLCRVCGGIAAFDPDVVHEAFRLHRAPRDGELFRQCHRGHLVKHPLIMAGHPMVNGAETGLKQSGRWTDG